VAWRQSARRVGLAFSSPSFKQSRKQHNYNKVDSKEIYEGEFSGSMIVLSR